MKKMDYLCKKDVVKTLIVNGYAKNEKEALKMVEGVLGTFKELILRRKPLVLKGFGTFKTIQREARVCRNPKTGETVEIPEGPRVRFKPVKNFLDS